MRRSEIREAVKAERERLISDLRGLSEEHWETPSLCVGWRVRDVAGHLIRVGEYYRPPYPFFWDLVRYGFRINKALADVARKIGSRPIPELLERLGRARYEETLVFRVHYQPLFALNEWIVHGQDIRRPLGLEATFVGRHLTTLAGLANKWYTLGTDNVVGGKRLEATDLDWSTGDGPVLQGPMEAILMALYGRKAALKDLEPQT